MAVFVFEVKRRLGGNSVGGGPFEDDALELGDPEPVVAEPHDVLSVAWPLSAGRPAMGKHPGHVHMHMYICMYIHTLGPANPLQQSKCLVAFGGLFR